jgi:hypothetical protein
MLYIANDKSLTLITVVVKDKKEKTTRTENIPSAEAWPAALPVTAIILSLLFT